MHTQHVMSYSTIDRENCREFLGDIFVCVCVLICNKIHYHAATINKPNIFSVGTLIVLKYYVIIGWWWWQKALAKCSNIEYLITFLTILNCIHRMHFVHIITQRHPYRYTHHSLSEMKQWNNGFFFVIFQHKTHKNFKVWNAVIESFLNAIIIEQTLCFFISNPYSSLTDVQLKWNWHGNSFLIFSIFTLINEQQ